MDNYDILGTAIARHWYQHYASRQEVPEQLLQQQIQEHYLSQCPDPLSMRILLMISHQKALHLYLHDPECRKPLEGSFHCFEQVNKRLSRLLS